MNHALVDRFVLCEIRVSRISPMDSLFHWNRRSLFVMSSLVLRIALAAILLSTQLLSSVAVAAGQQCAEGQCCCSQTAKASGNCCCRSHRTRKSCCHSRKPSLNERPALCGCGCRNDSSPTVPDPRPRDSRDRLPRSADQVQVPCGVSLAATESCAASELRLQPDALYGGVARQPLFCAWLL